MTDRSKDRARREMQTALNDKKRPSMPRSEERADWIGQELRRVYDQSVNEPIPDRLQDLLSKLRATDAEESEK